MCGYHLLGELEGAANRKLTRATVGLSPQLLQFLTARAYRYGMTLPVRQDSGSARPLLALLGLLDHQRLALQQQLQRPAVHALACRRVKLQPPPSELELIHVRAIVLQ